MVINVINGCTPNKYKVSWVQILMDYFALSFFFIAICFGVLALHNLFLYQKIDGNIHTCRIFKMWNNYIDKNTCLLHHSLICIYILVSSRVCEVQCVYKIELNIIKNTIIWYSLRTNLVVPFFYLAKSF